MFIDCNNNVMPFRNQPDVETARLTLNKLQKFIVKIVAEVDNKEICECGVIVKPRLIATHCHRPFESLEEGRQLKVLYNDEEVNINMSRCVTTAKVKFFNINFKLLV